jgi:hypothetical protein
VLVDLKLGKLTHQDLGQMLMYVNYDGRVQRADDEQKTIGIVLCSQQNAAMVKITWPDNDQIIANQLPPLPPHRGGVASRADPRARAGRTSATARSATAAAPRAQVEAMTAPAGVPCAVRVCLLAVYACRDTRITCTGTGTRVGGTAYRGCTFTSASGCYRPGRRWEGSAPSWALRCSSP